MSKKNLKFLSVTLCALFVLAIAGCSIEKAQEAASDAVAPSGDVVEKAAPAAKEKAAPAESAPKQAPAGGEGSGDPVGEGGV